MNTNETLTEVEREIGQFVRARRKAQGVSQEVLAERCHIVRRTLFSLERGEGGNLTTLLSVLSELGVLEEATAGFRAAVSDPERPRRKSAPKPGPRKVPSGDANPWVLTDRAIL